MKGRGAALGPRVAAVWLGMLSGAAVPATASRVLPVVDPVPSVRLCDSPSAVTAGERPVSFREFVGQDRLLGGGGARNAPAGSSLFGDGILAQRVLDEDEKPARKEPGPAKPKNPWKAMVFSAVLPGAGQFYVQPGNVLSLGFVGVEAVSWYLRSTWRRDGNDKIAEYKEWAWTGSVQRNEDGTATIEQEDGHWSWERWRDLRGTEGECCPANHDYDVVDSQLVEFYFTNEHEFYEDIGKYDKYCCGWRDPESREIYWDMREESNDLFDRARRMSQVILLNHVASAVHAYFTARSHNNRLAERASGSDLRWDVVPEAGGALRAQVVYTRRF